MVPWRVVRVALLEALVMPAFRRKISASARLPLASIRAFLHSIMPAPVRSRSSFTNFALISMASCRFLTIVRGQAASELLAFDLPPVACLFYRLRGAADCFAGFRSRTLAGQGHGRKIFVGKP